MTSPTDDPAPDEAKDFDQHLRRGALYNMLGLAAKLVYPAFVLVVTWFFGPELYGLYSLALSVGEIANSAVTAGFNEATTVFASRHADDPGAEAQLYQVLGNAFAITTGLSVVLMVGMYAGAGAIVEHWYADRPGLAGALRLLALSLPPAAVAQVAIASTKARMLMQYDAFINGLVKPLTLLSCSILAKILGLGLMGLIGANVVTQFVLAVLGVRAMAKHFSVRKAVRATLKPVWDREILDFAIPQTLNMTVNKYLTRVDVMLLGAFGFSNWHLGLYSAAAQITVNLREVKLMFSTALAPVAARHHARGDKAAFEETLSRVSRWTTAIAVPLVLAVAVLRTDLLRVVDASYARDSTTFMAWLLVPPFLSCAFGLAGNCLVYTGHTRWNLFNSVLVGALNTWFNWVMIPRWGLWGAAVATALASSLVSALQMVELYLVEGVRIRAAAVYKPHVALAVALAAFAVMGDPALLPSLGARVAVALLVAVGYGALMLGLRLEELAGVPVLRRLVRRA